ncbi:MAG: TrkH family potassium uptake protein [Calditrichae bacterium]|nr:TrkH family potassium uptake protein [Calditrichota bacterium]MCB9058393.1 TrkH family potassium uptake protein [Calditrichia bacterium]
MLHTKAISNILSALLLFLALSLIAPAIFAYINNEGDFSAFLTTIGFSFSIGIIVFLLTRNHNEELRAKDGFIIVTLGWLLFSFIGALPFYLSGFIPSYTDAFFETMSGFSTTGATILTDIEILPHGLLFWRSLTHWLGGMGIILLSLAILPLLGVGGMQLFKAEVPGPSPDKLTPRIKHTAELLWGVYLLLTVVEVILLRFGGMDWFDSVCHSFGTLATGGFSTKNASIGFYNSAYVDYVITLFMILAGLNFSLHYRALKGKPLIYFKDPESLFFFGIIIVATLAIFFSVWTQTSADFALSFRQAFFQVVSIITTTGYGTADYEQWSSMSRMILLILMFFGGCAGSTGGGLKIIRSLILIKFSLNEIKRLIHPQAVLPVRIGKIVVQRDIITNVAGFYLFYVTLFVFGVLFMNVLGLDIETALGGVAATIGNIGPALGDLGPTDNYSFIPDVGKWFMSFLMLVGRLEIYTVLVIFTPIFWKK